MDIADKASAARDVVRASGTENQPYRLESTELTPADEIGGEDEFPQYGDFLDVTALDGNGDELGPRWVECPGALARCLQDVDGDAFQVLTVEKTEDGAFRFDVEEYDA